MTLLFIFLAVVGGATLSVQASINGELGNRVGVYKTAFLTFSVGLLITSLLIFYFEPVKQSHLLNVPKWQLLGAMCGVPYILVMVIAVKRLGVALATLGVIFGQLTMSLLIDNFGWFANETVPLTATRAGAILCLAIALYFVYRSNRKSHA